MAIIVHVTTNFGTVAIESSDPNATVVIRNHDRVIREWQISNQQDAIKLRAGTYSVELKGKSPQLSLHPKTIDVARFDPVKITIRRKPLTAKGSVDSGDAADTRQLMAEVARLKNLLRDHKSNVDAQMLEMELTAMLPDDVSHKQFEDTMSQLVPEYAMLKGQLKELFDGKNATRDSVQDQIDQIKQQLLAIEHEHREEILSKLSSSKELLNDLQKEQAIAQQRGATYEGQSLKQWVHVIETEREPSRLVAAIRAVSLLTDGDPDVAYVARLLPHHAYPREVDDTTSGWGRADWPKSSRRNLSVSDRHGGRSART